MRMMIGLKIIPSTKAAKKQRGSKIATKMSTANRQSEDTKVAGQQTSRDQISTAQLTQEALITSALQLFGSKGFEATSTREIAGRADANIASIAYHFGSKEGLRLACTKSIIENLRQIIAQTILSSDPKGSPDSALEILENVIKTLGAFLILRPEARDIASFLVREMGNRGVVLDHICEEFIFPVHAKLCKIMSIAIDRDPESATVKLAIFTLIGQILYFRIGHDVVVKKMQWDQIGPDEIEQIMAVILQNLRSFVASNQDSSP